MASTSPVPSRAALNALRGVLFTTSCSVFLLAEERRRRLNIARAALENAKKLHTARSNRSAIALTADVVEEITSPPVAAERPLRNSYRRRRRDDLTNCILHDMDFEVHRHGFDYRTLESKGLEETAEMDSTTTLPRSLRPESSLGPLQFLTPATSTYPHDSGRHKRMTGMEGKIADLGRIRTLRDPAASTPSRDASRLPYETTLATLQRLLKELKSADATLPATPQILASAISALKELTHLQPSTPILDDLLKFEGLEVLKRAVELDRTQVPGVLALFCYRIQDCLRALSPFTHWLQERDDVQGFEELLDFMADRKWLRVWGGGMLIYRLLSTRSENGGDYKQTKGLYGMFLKAGLFDKIAVPRRMEYKIRRLMFSKAFHAGDEAVARAEMESICRLEPEMSKGDVKLQGILIQYEASLGNWDAVRAGLIALTHLVDADSSYFAGLLVKVTDMFATTHSAEDLETLLRGLARHYSIPLKHRWVDRILDGHASRRETGRMILWLDFCGDHGLKVDDRFLESYLLRCRKYLSFSEKTLDRLCRALGRPMPMGSPLDRSRGQQDSPRPQADLDSVVWASRADALKYMQSLEAHNEWERLCEAYARFQHSGLGFSVDILRLAVLGCIRQGDGDAGIEQASSLITSARDEGHDVGGALMPLLIARINRGDDGGALIQSALRSKIPVHDSVYNKATQSTLARGDLDGAIKLCQLAARENGKRKLLYSEHNFLNLVFAYMGSAQYGPLRDVVARFTSEVEWWKGSQRCKMSIKLAMKTAAMRAVVNPLARKKHEEVLFKLDEALTHVRRCRIVVGERQAVKEALLRLATGRREEEQEEAQAEERQGPTAMPSQEAPMAEVL